MKIGGGKPRKGREWVMRLAQLTVGSIHEATGICGEMMLDKRYFEHYKTSRAAGQHHSYFDLVETDAPEEALEPPLHPFPRTLQNLFGGRGGWVGSGGGLRSIVSSMVKQGEIVLEGGGRWEDDCNQGRLMVPPEVAAGEGWETCGGLGEVERACERRSTVGFDGGGWDWNRGIGITNWAEWQRGVEVTRPDAGVYCVERMPQTLNPDFLLVCPTFCWCEQSAMETGYSAETARYMAWALEVYP